MTPYNVRDDLSGKLGPAPSPDAPVADLRAYIARGFGIPDGYTVGRVVRYGGRAGTGLAVFVRPPGEGRELRIHYEKESDCSNPNKLRARAAADTCGLTRGELINSPRAALAMYEALCSLADNFEAADQEAQTWEWVQQLHRVAGQTTGRDESYQSLKRLQDHDYSKRLVQDPPTVRKQDGTVITLKPTPLLLVDEADGHVYITARHMAVFSALRPRRRGRRLRRRDPHPATADRRRTPPGAAVGLDRFRPSAQGGARAVPAAGTRPGREGRKLMCTSVYQSRSVPACTSPIPPACAYVGGIGHAGTPVQAAGGR
jgi:hypothetical protein